MNQSINLKSNNQFIYSDFRNYIIIILFLFQIFLIHYPLNFNFKLNNKVFNIKLNYYTVPLLFSILLLATTSISPNNLLNGILGSKEGIQPLSILILIFSLAYICISLDQSGLFSFLAIKINQNCPNPKFFFILFFLFTTLLGAIASNDVVILTLTPLILYFCQSLNWDPNPFLLSQFIAANTASLALYVGNPTNVVLSQAYKLSFINYSQLLTIPFILITLIELILLCFIFLNSLPNQVSRLTINPKELLLKPGSAIIGSLLLILCLIALVIGSFWEVQVWITTLPFALVMFLWDLSLDIKDCIFINENNKDNDPKSSFIEADIPHSIHTLSLQSINNSIQRKSISLEEFSLNKVPKEEVNIEKSTKSNMNTYNKILNLRNYFKNTYSILVRLPWGLLPFLIGMFIIVEALHQQNFTTLVASLIIKTLPPNIYAYTFILGFITALLCALINNLPASILISRILGTIDLSTQPELLGGTVIGIIIACNLGANLTTAGSLAGLMWRSRLELTNQYPGNWRLMKCSFLITPFVLGIGFLLGVIQMKYWGWGLELFN